MKLNEFEVEYNARRWLTHNPYVPPADQQSRVSLADRLLSLCDFLAHAAFLGTAGGMALIGCVTLYFAQSASSLELVALAGGPLLIAALASVPFWRSVVSLTADGRRRVFAVLTIMAAFVAIGAFWITWILLFGEEPSDGARFFTS